MAKICIFVQNDFMIKAILVSDKPQIVSRVNDIVATCCPNMKMVVHEDGVKAGVGAINEHQPDLIILDTKLKDGSGFDLVRHFDKPDFKIIFLSSSHDYAIKAIKFSAVDYILKPIDEEELTLAINKASELIRFEENLQQKALGGSIQDLTNSQRLVLKSSDQIHIVNIED
ncbi:MAG: response regulator, partial [Bacteroidota bacterium]|nr:response regulator [Bacteroidota bacterium]